MKLRSNQWILLLILAVSVVLRLFHFSEIPFTHDEFSALLRLDFDSFSALIDQGVKTDTHPAGVQVFLWYWTKMVGFSSQAIKFPFIVFGVLSVYLTYLIGKKWLNETVGLLSAATVSGLQYTVMYSQIARPYISGLFFSLLMVYFLTKLIQKPEKKFFLNGSLFVLSGALCAYNHHFSLLFAAIVGISGVFFIKKKFILRYILLGIAIFILYIPHLNIFFGQLKDGGVEGWLAKPTPGFILKYIRYIFNYSYLFMFTVLGIALGFVIAKKSIKINYKHYLLFFVWFMLPLLIGYVYSVNVNAVLQFSVLIFSFTFGVYLFFGHLPNCSPKTNLILVVSILVLGVYSLVFQRQHYTYFYQSCYIKVLEDYKKVNEEEDDVLSVIQSVDHINEYYTEKMNIDTNYAWFDDFQSMNDFKLFIEKNAPQHKKLYLGSMHNISPIAIPIIREYYPRIEMQHNYFGGTTYLFSKKSSTTPIISSLDFENDTLPNWSFHAQSLTDSSSFLGNNSYSMHTEEEWGPLYEEPLEDITKNKNMFIDVSVKAKPITSFNGALIVITLEENGESIYWTGTTLEECKMVTNSTSIWNTYHSSLKLSDIYLKSNNIRLKTFIWNKGKGTFLIDDYKLEMRKGNPVIYGIVNPVVSNR